MRLTLSQSLLAEELRKLGNDSAEVADYFKKHKIKGYPGTLHLCPVAQWIRSKFQAVCCCVVSKFAITICHNSDHPKKFEYVSLSSSCDYCVPGNIQEFVVDFDSGKYPFLELGGQKDVQVVKESVQA